MFWTRMRLSEGGNCFSNQEWPQRLHSPNLNLPPILSRNMGFLLFPIWISRWQFPFQILAAIHPSAGMCQDHSLESHPLKNSRNSSLCLKLCDISPRAHLLHVQLEFLGKQDTQMPENSFSTLGVVRAVRGSSTPRSPQCM